MSHTNLLIINVPTRWNSTYAMIRVAWDKRKVKVITCLKDDKGLSLIMSEEWG